MKSLQGQLSTCWLLPADFRGCLDGSPLLWRAQHGGVVVLRVDDVRSHVVVPVAPDEVPRSRTSQEAIHCALSGLRAWLVSLLVHRAEVEGPDCVAASDLSQLRRGHLLLGRARL